MIIQRVARGVAWSTEYHKEEKSVTKRSELRFAEETRGSTLGSLPESTSVV